MFKIRCLKLNTSRMQRPRVLTCTDDRPSLAHPSNTLKAATCVEWGLFLMQIIYPLHVIYTGWNHSCCYRLRLRKTSENSAQSTKILGDANQLKAPAMIPQFQHTQATPHHSNTLSELLGATPKVLLRTAAEALFRTRKVLFQHHSIGSLQTAALVMVCLLPASLRRGQINSQGISLGRATDNSGFIKIVSSFPPSSLRHGQTMKNSQG